MAAWASGAGASLLQAPSKPSRLTASAARSGIGLFIGRIDSAGLLGRLYSAKASACLARGMR
jgi:hypothetical protein